jgi:hypothetical protein
VLVVFSQGLSSNARLALDAEGWRRIVLVTAVTDAARPDPLARAPSCARDRRGGRAWHAVRVVGP